MKKVIIITLNFNQNQYTIDCINSLLHSTYDNYQIFLIDNGSTEENYKELQCKLPHDDKLIVKRLTRNRGYVGGVNYGLNEAEKLSPDYFLIMNNDTLIDSNAIKELVIACSNEEDNVIATGKTYDFDDNINRRIQYIGDKLIDKRTLKYQRIGAGEIDHGQFDEFAFRDMIDDIFWIIPYKVLKKNGYYSTLFYFNGESADYALRAKKYGYKLLYVPGARLWHKGSVSIGGKIDNPVKSFWISQSRTLLRLLHLKGFNKFYFALREFTIIMAIVLKNILRMESTKLYLSYSKLIGYLSVYHILTTGKNTGYNPFNSPE